MKNVLITGGSRGIGRSCVDIFSKNGYKVFFTYKSNKKCADEVQKSTGAIGIKCDISKSDEMIKISEIIEKYGNIDILVNNAGIAEQKLFCDITVDDWNKIISTNLTGMYLVTHLVVAGMIHNKSGSIVNISSIWGVNGGSMEVHYSASKGGVISFTKALAKELGSSGIRVNCVAPGVIDTDMNSNLSNDDLEELAGCTALGRIGTPEEVAEVVYFLSTKASFVTAEVIEVNGGIII